MKRFDSLQNRRIEIWNMGVLWAMTRLLCAVLPHVTPTEARADVICDSWPRGPALLDGALELLAGWQAALLFKLEKIIHENIGKLGKHSINKKNKDKERRKKRKTS